MDFFFDFMWTNKEKSTRCRTRCRFFVSRRSCRTWRWALWSLCEIALQRRSEEVFVWSCRFVYKNVGIFWALKNFKRLQKTSNEDFTSSKDFIRVHLSSSLRLYVFPFERFRLPCSVLTASCSPCWQRARWRIQMPSCKKEKNESIEKTNNIFEY